jgi:adenylylsulfate kinase-like enzyme
MAALAQNPGEQEPLGPLRRELPTAGSSMVQLIILCGHPAAGKSSVARSLAASLVAAGTAPVELVDEPSLHLDRNAGYAGGEQACVCSFGLVAHACPL